ncbi:MAG: hypothetical protein ACKVHR_18250 [Pirellulales bacterium]
MKKMQRARAIVCIGMGRLCLAASGCWKSASTELGEGLKYSDSEDYQNAITSFTTVIRLESGHAEAHYYRGLARYQTGLHEKLLRIIQKRF